MNQKIINYLKRKEKNGGIHSYVAILYLLSYTIRGQWNCAQSWEALL